MIRKRVICEQQIALFFSIWMILPMICQKCERENVAEATHCRFCGEKLNNTRIKAGNGATNKGIHSISWLYLSFKGRIPRSVYIKYYLVPFFTLYIFTGILDGYFGMFNYRTGIGVINIWFVIFSIYPALAVSVKRCHDRNFNWAFLLLGFIPIIGQLIVMYTLCCIKGTTGPNAYGPDPLAPPPFSGLFRE